MLPGTAAVNTATIGGDLPTVLIYGASLIVVLWCVIDAVRRPHMSCRLGRRRPRKKMNAQRW